MKIISEFTFDNIRASILEFLNTNPGWHGEGKIHEAISGSGIWEHFNQTFSALVEMVDGGEIETSGNNGFNHWSFRAKTRG